jgi:hypothetical protein
METVDVILLGHPVGAGDNLVRVTATVADVEQFVAEQADSGQWAHAVIDVCVAPVGPGARRLAGLIRTGPDGEVWWHYYRPTPEETIGELS